ncbi:14543_t:CDS:1, partial [Acaulospora colombiana]
DRFLAENREADVEEKPNSQGELQSASSGELSQNNTAPPINFAKDEPEELSTSLNNTRISDKDPMVGIEVQKSDHPKETPGKVNDINETKNDIQEPVQHDTEIHENSSECLPEIQEEAHVSEKGDTAIRHTTVTDEIVDESTQNQQSITESENKVET